MAAAVRTESGTTAANAHFVPLETLGIVSSGRMWAPRLKISNRRSLFLVAHVWIASHHFDLPVDERLCGGDVFRSQRRLALKGIPHVDDVAIAGFTGRRRSLVRSVA